MSETSGMPTHIGTVGPRMCRNWSSTKLIDIFGDANQRGKAVLMSRGYPRRGIQGSRVNLNRTSSTAAAAAPTVELYDASRCAYYTNDTILGWRRSSAYVEPQKHVMFLTCQHRQADVMFSFASVALLLHSTSGKTTPSLLNVR